MSSMPQYTGGVWSVKNVTQPAVEPVTLALAKSFCRIDPSSTESDAVMTMLIASARRKVEKHCNRKLITQTLEVAYDGYFQDLKSPIDEQNTPDWGYLQVIYGWNGSYFEIPRPPIQKVNSINFACVDGTTQSIDLNNMQVDLRSEPGRIGVKIGQIFPININALSSVVIQYVAGWCGPTEIGKVLIVTPVNNGTSGNYAINDVLTLVAAGGTGAQVTVKSVNADGTIQSFLLTTGGSGYTGGVTATTTGGGGSGATFAINHVGEGVPEDIQEAMCQIIMHAYQNRSSVEVGDPRIEVVEILQTGLELLSSWVVWKL